MRKERRVSGVGGARGKTKMRKEMLAPAAVGLLLSGSSMSSWDTFIIL